MDKNRALQFIEKYKAVAVLRLTDSSIYDEVEEALISGGVKIIEITMTTPGALKLIERASKRAGNNCLIGVGSVTDANSVNRAADAGAGFIVSPVVKSSVIKAAVERNITIIPGAFTPSEILRSLDLGADVVKT